MTNGTPAPDGGTPAPAPTQVAAPAQPPDGSRSGEPLHNLGDLKAAAAARDTYKAKAEALEARLQEIEGVDAAKQLKQMQERADAAEAKAKKLQESIEQGQRRDRRRQAVDAALQGASPDHKEELGYLLDGMAARGEIDLEADNPNDAGEAARKKLAERFPVYFTAGDGSPAAGIPARGARDLGNVQVPTDLTPDELAALSPEDFQRMFTSRAPKNIGV